MRIEILIEFCLCYFLSDDDKFSPGFMHLLDIFEYGWRTEYTIYEYDSILSWWLLANSLFDSLSIFL